MSFFSNLLSTVVTGRNYFARDDLGRFPSEHVETVILSQCSDCQGRPDAIVQAASYRELPDFGTWPGMEIAEKIASHTWHVHYEDYKI